MTNTDAPAATTFRITIDTHAGPVTTSVIALTYRDAYFGAVEDYVTDPDAFLFAALRERLEESGYTLAPGCTCAIAVDAETGRCESCLIAGR